MLDKIIKWSLHYRMLVVITSLVTLVYGTYLATQLPIDVFPDLDRPRVVVITEAPGLATEEVETLVTQPIEIALMGANGVQAVRSQTTAGLNVIFIEFDWNTQIRAARQTVSERLNTLAGVLPAGIRPQMTPPSSIMGQIVVAGIYRQAGPSGGVLSPVGTSGLVAELYFDEKTPTVKVWSAVDRHDFATWTPVEYQALEWVSQPASSESEGPVGTAIVELAGETYQTSFLSRSEQQMDLRTIADWVIRPRLLKVTGVAEVFMLGGDRKQYQILLDPTALLEYDVTVQDVQRSLRESNINTSGGFAITGETERPIRVLGRLGSETGDILRDLKKIAIAKRPKRTVLLEQVASVQEGPELKRGDGSVNGEGGIVFTVVKQPHVDTRKLTDDVAQAFREVESTLPADIIVNSELFRLKNFIDRGIFNVAEALVIGATLVIVVLFVFLLNFRTTFITLTAIPLSLVMTTLVFRVIGWLTNSELTINVMTLGGIAVAMGELVDDAIVDVENIFRRLKENHSREQPLPAIQVVYEASREIRSSILFGTGVVILVFLPLFALSGIEGRLFAPLGFAYIVSILASFAISLTVTPVLSLYLLPNAPAARHGNDGTLLRFLKSLATPLIRFSMTFPNTLLTLTWFGVGIAIFQLSTLGRNFLPPFDEGSVQVNVTLPPGSSLQASNLVSESIDDVFKSMQKSPENPSGEILSFVRRTGRAEMDEHAAPVNFGEYILSMNPESEQDRDSLLAELLGRIKSEAPGVDVEVEQPLAHLISHMVSGVYAQIAIKINGDDLDTLIALANRVEASIGDVDGITPPIVEPVRMTPELHIELRGDDLALYGLTRQYVADVLQTALQGEIVSEVLVGQRRFDLLIRMEEAYRTDYANLGRLRIDLPHASGDSERGQIELRDVATLSEGTGPNSVNRENARRRIVIRCNTQGRDLASAVQEIQSRVETQVQLPVGYYVEYAGQFESQQNATRMIIALAGVAVLGMFGILMILFPSIRIVLQILNALPTAFIGGVLALVVTGQDLTVASLVGFVSLGGIAVRNGILLVTHYFHLMREEREPFSQAMIIRGSLERLAPVLMTALTAGIGLIPLVVGGQEPGREILYPVATVILGGLVTSTFCEFLIHPGLFWKLSGQDAKRLAETEDADSLRGLER
ncbi:efflux RND transporter permease subunit [Rhodopirellula sp. MGV]|uniref:efflux RND transporter permease subunit n=1 Tax=Rhodopirellula sp. MGV TaxID=2023130 RepID=UPI000B968DA7|nr:efflux RND transporter permease subunit [Rhodopirellula sp. MGV]OYP38209.1 CusA/CzcA family heavy metal efflux RND transporter [Rhodopirellula sp. MGV]PNY38546.1 AcrB/AcrD/AcrF family protein [Rhodopirellula baltica]